MPGFDLNQVSRNDKGILGAGIVAFIASFLPYWGVSYHLAGIHESASIDAWHGYAVLGLLLLFVAAIVVALRVFANANVPRLPVGINVAVAAVAALGTLLVILRGFTYPHAHYAGASWGVKWGGYVLFIAAIVETVFAVLNFRASGEKLAWDSSVLNRGHAATGTPANPTYPAAPTSYGQPVPPQTYVPPTYGQSGNAAGYGYAEPASAEQPVPLDPPAPSV